MKFKKGDKVELANGTPCIIAGEYAAHDGQAYRVQWDDGKDASTAKLTAHESYGVTERDQNPAAYCPLCGKGWTMVDGYNRVTGRCGHVWPA